MMIWLLWSIDIEGCEYLSIVLTEYICLKLATLKHDETGQLLLQNEGQIINVNITFKCY